MNTPTKIMMPHTFRPTTLARRLLELAGPGKFYSLLQTLDADQYQQFQREARTLDQYAMAVYGHCAALFPMTEIDYLLMWADFEDATTGQLFTDLQFGIPLYVMGLDYNYEISSRTISAPLIFRGMPTSQDEVDRYRQQQQYFMPHNFSSMWDSDNTQKAVDLFPTIDEFLALAQVGNISPLPPNGYEFIPPFDALPILWDYAGNDTGNLFMDQDNLSNAEMQNYPDWTIDMIDNLAGEWARAKPMLQDMENLAFAGDTDLIVFRDVIRILKRDATVWPRVTRQIKGTGTYTPAPLFTGQSPFRAR